MQSKALPKPHEVVANYFSEPISNFQIDEDGKVYRLGEYIGDSYNQVEEVGDARPHFYRFKPNLDSKYVKELLGYEGKLGKAIRRTNILRLINRIMWGLAILGWGILIYRLIKFYLTNN